MQVVDVPLGSGQRGHALYMAPPHPRAAVVMLPGGSGDLGLKSDGTIEHGDNFVVRTRDAWIARGYALLIPDGIDGGSLRGHRSSAAYAQVVVDLANDLHTRVRRPVFLLGTSQGAIGAMNGAAHSEPGGLTGVVLTESVARRGGSHETVFDADPQDVRVPALIVANTQDACDVASPDMAPRIAAALTRSPSVKLLSVSGGTTAGRGSRPCGSLSPHGYYGLETEVIDQIDAWMRSIGKP